MRTLTGEKKSDFSRFARLTKIERVFFIKERRRDKFVLFFNEYSSDFSAAFREIALRLFRFVVGNEDNEPFDVLFAEVAIERRVVRDRVREILAIGAGKTNELPKSLR